VEVTWKYLVTRTNACLFVLIGVIVAVNTKCQLSIINAQLIDN